MVHRGGRPRNPIFWSHVKEIDAKKVKCNHCGKEFAKSVQRIKTHLTGEGKGVLPCKPDVIELIRDEVAAGEHDNAGVNDNNMNFDVMNPGTDTEAAYDGTQAMPEIVIQSNRESTGENVCAVNQSTRRADNMGLGADDNAATRESTGEDVCAVTTSRDATVSLPPIASQNMSQPSCMVGIDLDLDLDLDLDMNMQDETSTAMDHVNNNILESATCRGLEGAVTSSNAAEPAWAATVRDMPLYSNTPAFHFDGLPSYDNQVGLDPAAMLPYEHEEDRDVVVSTSAASSFGNCAAKLSSIATLSSNDEQHPPPAAAALQNEPPVLGSASAKLPSIHEQVGGTVAAAALLNQEPTDMEAWNSYFEDRIDQNCESMFGFSSRFVDRVYQQAMQKPNKRVRLQDSSLASSSNDSETIKKRADEEYVAAAFLKFVYCISVPSVANDLVKDPLYMNFVERASKLGIPSSSVWCDSRFMTRLASRIQGEVNVYIHHVKESWKTTGCTRVVFNLQLLPNREDVATAFYCPNGVFFEPGNNAVGDYYQEYVNALSHSNCIKLDNFEGGFLERLFDEEYESFKAEEGYIGEDNLCELTDLTISEMQNRSDGRTLCIRNQIQYWCIIICHRLEWADNLISIAGQIHTILCSSRQIESWYYKMLRRKCSSFKVLANNHYPRANRLAIFISILSIRNELSPGCQLHSESYIKLARDEIRAITNGSTFWREGCKLEVILEYVMKIGDVMDTFVPTAGYLGMALNEVDRTVREHLVPEISGGALLFWDKLRSAIEFSYFEDLDNHAFVEVNYLNPVYFLQQLQKNSKPQMWLKGILKRKYHEEVDRYADEFKKVPADYKLEQHHPVEVWKKYGKSLPNLQKKAIKALSQPLSCMCKEVKKHLYQLEGAEDYIFKLNVRMMQHFNHFRDDIYKPLDLSSLGVVLYGLEIESESE